jgi:hypothetical protein
LICGVYSGNLLREQVAPHHPAAVAVVPMAGKEVSDEGVLEAVRIGDPGRHFTKRNKHRPFQGNLGSGAYIFNA